MGGANEAKKGVFSIANDVSSWWANLDPGVPKPSQPSATASRSAAEAQQVIPQLRAVPDVTKYVIIWSSLKPGRHGGPPHIALSHRG